MTDKQQLWLTYYKSGKSPAQAAKCAGYKGSFSSIGKRNLIELKDDIELAYLIDTAAQEEDFARKNTVAGIEEIILFWSELLRSENVDLKDKLKVSELLAKVQGAFSYNPSEEDETQNLGVEQMPLADKLALIERMKEGISVDEI